MKVDYPALILNTEEAVDVSVIEITKCPRCKVSIKPIHLNSIITYDSKKFESYYDKISNSYVNFEMEVLMESHLLCNSCKHSFIAEYEAIVQCFDDEFTYFADYFATVHPNFFVKESFSDSIRKVSPNFVKIFNQALSAETSGLDEIAGLGYRKALEFLVKDFSIYGNPTNKDSIISAPLSQCIKIYIDNDRIKTLAERSTWIGNDEAHYLRKHEDRSCEDMKAFIQAIVYFISMILITEDASSMLPK